jgi:drug/metabolite transporter (DMT)-like permease
MTTLSQSDGRAASQHRRGLLLVGGAATVWSSGGLIARLIETDPWTTVFWRSVAAATALLLYIAIRERGSVAAPFRRLGWPGLITALCFATASTAFVVALRHTTVANILLIVATAPFIAGGFGWLLMGERVRGRTWCAMAAALAGIAVMVSDSLSHGSLIGTLLAMLNAFAFAGAIVTTRRHCEVRMTPATCLASVFGVLIAAPLAAPLTVSVHDLTLCMLFGAGQLAVGLILFTTGARLAPAGEVGLVSLLEDILGPLWVGIAFGENPGRGAIIGGVIVLAALVVHTLLDLRTERVTPPAL